MVRKMENESQTADENLWCVEADKFYTKIIPHHFSLSPSSPPTRMGLFY